MKICKDCNVEMSENYNLRAIVPYSEPIKGEPSIKLSTFNKTQVKEELVYSFYDLKCRVCPNCGKVEMFIDLKIK